MKGLHIYDLQGEYSKLHFLVICNKHTTFPKEFYSMRETTNYGRRFDFRIVVDNYSFEFKTNEEWFNDVLGGSIEAWECACLNKKFIIKEHVKLLMKTDPLGLRKQIIKMDSKITEDSSIEDMWKVICYCKFANQIIENHKIVNFKEAIPEMTGLRVCDYPFRTYKYDLSKPLELLKKSTDGMLKKELQGKIIQK